MKCVAVAFVIDGYKVHHEHVVRIGVQSKQPNLQRRKHPPESSSIRLILLCLHSPMHRQLSSPIHGFIQGFPFPSRKNLGRILKESVRNPFPVSKTPLGRRIPKQLPENLQELWTFDFLTRALGFSEILKES